MTAQRARRAADNTPGSCAGPSPQHGAAICGVHASGGSRSPCNGQGTSCRASAGERAGRQQRRGRRQQRAGSGGRHCSHIRADAALRNARASLAKAGALPLGDSWCAASDRVSLSSPARIELALNVSGGTALTLKVGPATLACRSSCSAAQQPEHHYVLDALLSAARMLAGVTG